MRVLALDTETSGIARFDRPADDPCQPRICSLGYVLFDPESDLAPFADVPVYDLIRPDGWIVPLDAARIHGLTTEKLQAEGLPIHEALDRFLVAWTLSDMVAGYNIRFDLKLVRGELRRDGRQYEERPTVDVMRAVDPCCKIAPTHKQMAAGFRHSKLPTLTEACDILLGKPLDGAHNALADAEATVELYRWLRAHGKLPRQ